MKAWEPSGGYDAFLDRCLEKRGKGRTWRAIAVDEGISHVTLYDWFLRNPKFQPLIKKEERGVRRDNIVQTLMEVAIKNKNVTALIFLAKSLCKMYDQPYQKEKSADPAKSAEQHPSMTPEQAKELLKARLTLVQEKP